MALSNLVLPNPLGPSTDTRSPLEWVKKKEEEEEREKEYEEEMEEGKSQEVEYRSGEGVEGDE